MIPAILLAAWGFFQSPSLQAGWLQGVRLALAAAFAALCVLKASVRPGRGRPPQPRPGRQRRSPVLQDGRTAVPRRETHCAPAPLQDNRPKYEVRNTTGGNDR